MDLPKLLKALESEGAFIVHCSRSNRGGEIAPKPLYPADLKCTIADLKAVSGRSISCSVVWPSHQETFGEIGIIVKPRAVEEIVRLSSTDGGTLEDGQGVGSPLSEEAVEEIFSAPSGHNEWVLIGGEVVGIFLNLSMGLFVARRLESLPGMDAAAAAAFGFGAEPYPHEISIREVAADFPGVPLFCFVGGKLVEIDPNDKSTVLRHPYSEDGASVA